MQFENVAGGEEDCFLRHGLMAYTAFRLNL